MNDLPSATKIETEGVVEDITYKNDETGYTIAKIKEKGTRKNITIIGSLPGIQPGETISVQGSWTNHPQYGRQLEISSYGIKPPQTIDAIKRYLASGLIKGVGKVTAGRITDYFGEESLEILDNNPQRLIEVPKIGRKKASQIQMSWEEQKQIKDVMIFLQKYGVGVALSVKIFKYYGQDAILTIQKNPYQLVKDINGVGFLTADRIALEMGIKNDSILRIQAGLVYALETMSQEGHCYAERQQLIDTCSKLIHLSPDLCDQQIAELLEKKSLMGDDQIVYLPYYFVAERSVAADLLRLMNTSRDSLGFLSAMDWDKSSNLGMSNEINLTEEQMDAVRMVFSNKVSILTGGPGTGKSTITGSIIQYLQAFGNTVLLAAPTGRAAKRLSEATGLEALTIHRLLEYSPQKEIFLHNHSNPLKTDILIIDETSMVDILLMKSLLDAVSEGTHVLFIGDADQLPSVGPGNVLRDMIDSSVIPVIRLTHIFRQSKNSYIIENAHSINQGKMPSFPNDAEDFFLFAMEDSQKSEDWIIDIVTHRLPARFGITPHEIQVLSPMYKGPAGVNALNQRLQNTLNPSKPSKHQYQNGDRIFREGDRVMQLRNNYDKLVYNGDIGDISRIDPEDQIIEVTFDDRIIQYDFHETDEMQLAYAISIHKSQGSEFPVVVLPVIMSHYIMLQRNLIYTAITRARKIVVLVGSRKAISISINNNQTNKRNTKLSEFLKNPSNLF